MNDNSKIKIFLYVICGLIIISFISNVFYSERRYNRKLEGMSESITNITSSVSELGSTIRQQESTISDLRGFQSELESEIKGLGSLISELKGLSEQSIESINSLRETEQNIDGITGSIRGTTKRIESAIDLTIKGIEEEGIQQ